MYKTHKKCDKGKNCTCKSTTIDYKSLDAPDMPLKANKMQRNESTVYRGGSGVKPKTYVSPFKKARKSLK